MTSANTLRVGGGAEAPGGEALTPGTLANHWISKSDDAPRGRRPPGARSRNTLARFVLHKGSKAGSQVHSLTKGVSRACLSVGFVVSVIACGGGEKVSTLPEAARAEAKQIFSTRCAACHGAEGRGDGAASASLSPKPANFNDGTWQSGVTDGHIDKIIQFGGAAVGKSPSMPGNPDLTSKPDVVAGLREHIRSLKM